METAVNQILKMQRQAWNNGHENYGTALDVKAAMLYFLQYFKHLNPAQKELFDELEKIEELKYAKRLCSRAHKSVRHFIVTLK